jgi:hypothetical protein
MFCVPFELEDEEEALLPHAATPTSIVADATRATAFLKLIIFDLPTPPAGDIFDSVISRRKAAANHFFTANVFNHTHLYRNKQQIYVQFFHLKAHYCGDSEQIVTFLSICEPLQSFFIFFISYDEKPWIETSSQPLGALR